MKIPLAWLQLSRERIRFLVAIAGIGFADILMFIQVGFRDALLDSTTTLHQSFDGDIFLLSPQTDASISLKTFSRRRLYESLALEGVKSVAPVYVQFGLWKNPLENNSRTLGIIGFNPSQNVFNITGVEQNLDTIKLADVVLFDSLSRSEFGPIPKLLDEGNTVTAEVESRRVTVGGLFTLGASFAADGWLITSDLNFLRIFDNREPGLIDIGIIWLEPGANLDTVIQDLRAQLPKDVVVLTRAEFIQKERIYWENSTAIGFIFNLGLGIAFVVGSVIVYQILYTDGYFVIVVFQEALILAILGFLPSLVITTVLYNFAAAGANLPIFMTLNKAITILILTIIMCACSGLVAVRKLSDADPADIF